MSPSDGPPQVIGLLGGIAAGKTTVAEMLAELGATVVSADAIAHAVLDSPQTRERIVARWGDEVVGDSGKVDRDGLAERVFGDPEELAALEAITHPAICVALRQRIDEALRSQDAVAVVIDAPLLLEADLDGLCDVLVFVQCPREVRLARAEARGWDAEELDHRESHQQPLELKRERADATIDGSANLETTFQQVQQLWRRTLGL
jgi:dephospho-CoA kinase